MKIDSMEQPTSDCSTSVRPSAASSCAASVTQQPVAPLQSITVPTQTLRDIVQQFGTPTYAYDINRIRQQVEKLQTHLPASVDILYSLKANASLGVSSILADCGLGADVASAGELEIARAAGFAPSRIVLTGPDKSPAVIEQLRSMPEVLVSLDSVSELELFAQEQLPNRIMLRLRPDFSSYATCSAGPDSRFGLTMADLPACRRVLSSAQMPVVGFHIFSGSQVLVEEGVIHHLREGLDLALRAANELNVSPEIVDIGGGFGIPYGPEESELALAVIGDALRSLEATAAPARLVIELGRYFIAQAGWYLTTVIGQQTRDGRPAVVIDGGSHQRTDLCGIGLSHKVVPFVLNNTNDARCEPTDVLGCLSLPADVLLESGLLPPLSRGDLLAFPIAGAYGLYSAACLFHAHPIPAEAAFADERIFVLRERSTMQSVLDGQRRLSD